MTTWPELIQRFFYRCHLDDFEKALRAGVTYEVTHSLPVWDGRRVIGARFEQYQDKIRTFSILIALSSLQGKLSIDVTGATFALEQMRIWLNGGTSGPSSGILTALQMMLDNSGVDTSGLQHTMLHEMIVSEFCSCEPLERMRLAFVFLGTGSACGRPRQC
jgi:hypothetical protein